MNIPHIFRLAVWILGVAAFLVAAWYLLEHVPQETASQVRGDTPARLEAFNAARTTGAQIFLGLGIFAGLVLTWRRIRSTERQAATAEAGMITERFTRAIEQLGTGGEDKVAIRLGGIYALERILRDSEADAPTVQEVLAAWLREELQRRAVTQAEQAERADPKYDAASRAIPFPLDIDLKAALSVLGRNPLADRWPDLRGVNLAHRNLERLDLIQLNFSVADLRGARLWRAELSEANLHSAKLTGAELSYADLTRAQLSYADVKGATLTFTQLIGANLYRAKLKAADLRWANLTRAKLEGAVLPGANLTRANLTDADLTDADLTGAKGANLSRVRRLPDGSRPPDADPAPQ